MPTSLQYNLQSAAKRNTFWSTLCRNQPAVNASSPIPATSGSFYPTKPPPKQIPKKECSVNTSYFFQEVTLGAAEYCKIGIASINRISLHLNLCVCVCVCVWRRAAVAWHVNPSNRWKSSASQPGLASPKSWPTQCREQNMLLPLSNTNPIPKA